MRPNILLVLVDSAQAGAYAANGGQADTPAFDRLAAEGVNAARCWSTCPICHPARSALITGLYPYANGMLTNGTFAGGWPFQVRDDVPTLPAVLREHGYRTGYAGQMHIEIDGWDDDRHETTKQFHDWLAAQGYRESPPEEQRYWHCGRVDYTIDQTREGRFTARGLELLDDLCAQSQPWFLQLDYDGPHPPCWLPQPYAERYDPTALRLPETLRDDLAGRPEWIKLARRRQNSSTRSNEEWRTLNAYYHGSITMIDELVGRVLARLDQNGVAENTLVVFTSDHATPIGHHGFAVHGGPALYEDVLRVPCAFRWPDGLPAGTRCDAAVQHVDLLPTLLDAAGVAAPTGHGHSVLPALRGEPDDHPDRSYHVYSGTGTAFFSVRAYREGPWKLVYTPYGEAELYDLGQDPLETVNLAGRGLAEEGRLRRAMLARMEQVDDPLRRFARSDLDVP